MLISIVIPTHNDGHFIGGLLNSIFKFIKNEFEIIIVNNGSKDNTQEVISDYDCSVITLDEKVTPSEARNIGAKNATGKYLIFLDSDVLVTDQWSQQLDKLISDESSLPKYFITGCSYYMSINPSWIENHWFEPLRKKEKAYINGGNIITTLETYNYANGFDEALETGEDVDFSIRARSLGVKIIINNNWKVHHEGFPKTIKDFLKREAWHGKGDYKSIKTILNSKIAIATLFFMMFHIYFIFSLIELARTDKIIYLYSTIISLFLILLTSHIRASKDIKTNCIKDLIISPFVSYLYFFGRSFSIISVLKDKFKRGFK